MQTAVKILTTVLPGHRIEISSPQLLEGAAVEVVVTPSEQPARHSFGRREILRMPIEQRRQMMEQQSAGLAAYYESSDDRFDWQGGDILE